MSWTQFLVDFVSLSGIIPFILWYDKDMKASFTNWIESLNPFRPLGSSLVEDECSIRKEASSKICNFTTFSKIWAVLNSCWQVADPHKIPRGSLRFRSVKVKASVSLRVSLKQIIKSYIRKLSDARPLGTTTTTSAGVFQHFQKISLSTLSLVVGLVWLCNWIVLREKEMDELLLRYDHPKSLPLC